MFEDILQLRPSRIDVAAQKTKRARAIALMKSGVDWAILGEVDGLRRAASVLASEYQRLHDDCTAMEAQLRDRGVAVDDLGDEVLDAVIDDETSVLGFAVTEAHVSLQELRRELDRPQEAAANRGVNLALAAELVGTRTLADVT